MSRRCKGCSKQFRPEFGNQRICWDCFRRASGDITTTKEENMTTSTEVVEGELLPDVYDPPAPPTLFGSVPALALERMGELADALMHVVRDRKLAVGIRGKEFLTVEAWTTLGALVGVHAAIAWTRPNETGDGILARAEARTLSGALVGAGEAECSRSEQRWKSAEPHAIRAMAQTRALSRALQAPLRHIAVLAGYAGASADEMPPEENRSSAPEREPKIPPAAQPTEEQKAAIGALIVRLTAQQPEVDWRERCRELAGVPGDKLTRGGADGLLRKLQALDREPGEVPFE